MREFKSATVKNGKARIGDKVIYVTNSSDWKSFHGTVARIYRDFHGWLCVNVKNCPQYPNGITVSANTLYVATK